MEALIIAGMDLVWKIYANHANKPEGWKPTDEDKQNLLDIVDAATPEAVKAEARKALGLPEPTDAKDTAGAS